MVNRPPTSNKKQSRPRNQTHKTMRIVTLTAVPLLVGAFLAWRFIDNSRRIQGPNISRSTTSSSPEGNAKDVEPDNDLAALPLAATEFDSTQATDTFQTTSVTRAFPADAGVIDVTAYGAIPNDGIDDTAAIQRALDEAPSGNRIIYLPMGTYLISDQLDWPAGETSAGNHKRTILQGENRDLTVIRLHNNASKYQDPDNPLAVIWTGTAPANRFRNAVRDLTINTGTGNPGAIGLQFIANNQGGIRNVAIISDDGQGQIGLDMKYTREIGPAYVEGLYIQGFDYGIQTYSQVNSITFENIRLEDQNILGWENFAQSIFIRGLHSINAVTVLKNTIDAPGSVTLIDAHLVGKGNAINAPAILNQTREMFLRNIETSGYAMSVSHDHKGRGNEPGVTDAYIEEWLARGEEPDSLFPGSSTSLNLPIQATPIVPWDTVSEWVSPLAFGGQPDDSEDDTAAIQAAIDSGATTVYLPNGRWHISGVLEIRGNVRRFLGTEAWLIGDNAEIRILETSQPVVQIERLDMLRGNIDIVHASEQTLVLSSLTMNGKYRSRSDLPRVGDLYIEDVVGGPFYFANQSVWARQINPETDTQKTEDPAKIINEGADLWILGLKTERAGTNIQTLNGGRTEVIGGLVYSTGDPKIDPAFVNIESSLSLAGVVERNFNGNWFGIWVQEVHNDETRNMPRSQISAPLYVGFEK
ncbi:glycosyl hydrolase family 28-related protein [Oscillatoria sp. CS-180]|uniref:glycoside hydrolase family 55 protein n=1 Tax=Oscillatoria sp. CS-180 TaxID=3021720 RepID=UPI0023310EC5|nr:glycoside hydrolase family 55 protein [Oscillatoria sp. CS-180]MDB9527384.1 glycosyl hydrolase family 28-related protein [Oscillatoria sp. CS-180]